MGCWQSRNKEAAEAAKSKEAPTATSAPAASSSIAAPAPAPAPAAGVGTSAGAAAAPAKKKLDPKDFMFSNLKGETRVKKPGSVNGQMFILEDSEDCDLFVCSSSSAVTIDYMKNCRIFVGPIASSIFVRNCDNCQFIIACQQFRTRDCNDCDFLLYVETEPVIEDSKNMRFGCFRYNYFSLRGQFDEAKLRLYDNKWSELYDFTPSGGEHYTFLPPETTAETLGFKKLSEISDFVTAEEEAQLKDDDVVPLTWGKRPRPSGESCFALALPGHESSNVITDFLAAAKRENPDVVLVRTVVVPALDKGKAATLLSKGGDKGAAIAGAGTAAPSVGLELAGPNAVAVAGAAAAGLEGLYVSPSTEAAQHEARIVFEQWKENAGHAVR